MTKQILTDLSFENVSRIINLPEGTDPSHPVTLSQLNSSVEGLSWKESVRVSTSANINLVTPGSSIDGIALSVGDRVLVKDQTLPYQNGIYIWNGASTLMTRSLDANSTSELEQAIVSVEEGSSSGASYRQTSINFTLETNDIIWVSFAASTPQATETTAGKAEIATQSETDAGVSDSTIVTPLKLNTWSGKSLKHSELIGDNVSTQFTITHNFNTRDVTVSVYRNSGNYDQVLVDIEHSTVNNITVRFNSAPTSNSFRVVVLA